MSLRIGFVCNEYFHFNEANGNFKPSRAHGGFGFLTKVKAEYLAERGYEVHVFVPGENFDTNTMETKVISNVYVHTYRTNYDKGSFLGKAMREIKGLTLNRDLEKYFNEIKLDILQSEDTPPPDLLISKSLKIPFIMVFQDPFNYFDVNLLIDSERNYLNIQNSGILGYEIKPTINAFKNSYFINLAHKKNFIKPMHKFQTSNRNKIHNYAEAEFIANKSKQIFNLVKTPDILLNPIKVYDHTRNKFGNPTICWVARWDPQKRPDIALLIAEKMPDVTFIMIGTATNSSKGYQKVEKYLKDSVAMIGLLNIFGNTILPEGCGHSFCRKINILQEPSSLISSS